MSGRGSRPAEVLAAEDQDVDWRYVPRNHLVLPHQEQEPLDVDSSSSDGMGCELYSSAISGSWTCAKWIHDAGQGKELKRRNMGGCVIV